jgi:transposase-like protein
MGVRTLTPPRKKRASIFDKVRSDPRLCCPKCLYFTTVATIAEGRAGTDRACSHCGYEWTLDGGTPHPNMR